MFGVTSLIFLTNCTCLSPGYDTPGTEKTIQSETESHNEITPADLTDGPFVINQIVPKTENRGMFLEVKGNEINKAIYGDTEPPSLRGVPGQVRHALSVIKTCLIISE